MTVATAYKLVIPAWRPASTNELMKSVRARIKLKKRDRMFILAYARRDRIPPAVLPRQVSLAITLPPGGRACDPDNLWKSLLDALVHAGLLIDDDHQHCELGPVTFTRGRTLETAITLEDLP
jgi:hypothetical protein